MTRIEHLLIRAMEECNEVAQRISKALLFGMEQRQEDADDSPEQNPRHLTNRERIIEEYYDLRATLGMAGFDAWEWSDRSRMAEFKKVAKVNRYLKRSQQCGTLQEEISGQGVVDHFIWAAQRMSQEQIAFALDRAARSKK